MKPVKLITLFIAACKLVRIPACCCRMESWDDGARIKAAMEVILELEDEASARIEAMPGLIDLLAFLQEKKVVCVCRGWWWGGKTGVATAVCKCPNTRHGLAVGRWQLALSCPPPPPP
jgi:hypothetical protein